MWDLLITNRDCELLIEALKCLHFHVHGDEEKRLKIEQLRKYLEQEKPE